MADGIADWSDPTDHCEALTAGILDAICKRAQQEGALSDTSLLQLNCLYDKMLASALDLVDHATITKLTLRSSEESRAFWKVQSTSGHVYHCFSGYCNCQAFAFRLSHAAEHSLLCKHQLAIRLAEPIGAFKTQQLDDEVWGVELLRGCGESAR
jgi:predicted nucleic acid-binding Zn finger protein